MVKILEQVEIKPPDLLQTEELINQLRLVSSRLSEMKEELAPAIEQFEDTKKEKTGLTDALRRTLLTETEGYAPASYYDDLLETYYENELVITSEGTFIRDVIAYADAYQQKTGVDIIGALLSVSIGGLKKRLMENPEEFHMVKSTQDNNDLWVGNGVKIVRN